MTDHFEHSMDDDYGVFENAEDGFTDDPPGTGSLLPLVVKTSPSPQAFRALYL
jgi:hypothetical protein